VDLEQVFAAAQRHVGRRSEAQGRWQRRAMIVLLRLVIIGITALLSAAGLFLVVVALLAAQWVVVAGVVLFVMGVVGGALALVKRLVRSAAGSASEN
jgi:uncharacterized membrane protein